jgi:hypothetical protein
MCGRSLWNPARGLDKAERPDISDLVVRHVWLESLESG